LIVVRDKETKTKIARAHYSRYPGPNDEMRTTKGIADAPVVIVACNMVRDANMRYFGPDGEEPITFSNQSRKADSSRYWDEYVEHSRNHTGEYESMGSWDLAIALDHLSLAAVEEGLGTCWKGVLDERELREILSIPEEVQARMIMILGYPDVSPGPKKRKPIGELVCYEKYK
jgi:nitroreductase